MNKVTQKKLRELARNVIAAELVKGGAANQVLMSIAVQVLHAPQVRGE